MNIFWYIAKVAKFEMSAALFFAPLHRNNRSRDAHSGQTQESPGQKWQEGGLSCAAGIRPWSSDSEHIIHLHYLYVFFRNRQLRTQISRLIKGYSGKKHFQGNGHKGAERNA